MTKDLTFESACKIIKDEYPDVAPDIDAFLNIAMATGVTTLAVPIAVASGVAALTPAVIALTAIGTLSNLFGVKNEIFKVGERIISKLTKRDQNIHEQYRHIRQAYTLICYTAFFETLASDKQLAPLLKKIKITREEKILTAIAASKDLWGQPSTATDSSERTPDQLTVFKYEVAMPQPGDTLETQCQCLTPLYEQLARRVAAFFELEIIKPHIQNEHKKALIELPKKALDTFVTQYYMLATKFPEFAVWLNLKKDNKLIQLAEQSRQRLENISQVMEQQQTNDVLHLLANHYRSVIDAPIINDPDSGLTYPAKRDIFILQSFKVTRYKGAEQLKKSFWDSLPVRDDLQAFLSAYFNHDEASTQTPLIILGQPGSGKSLLTNMIAAHYIPLPFTPIRVELRHTNAEDTMSAQIESQIRRDTDRSFDWATLRAHTVNGPALVLFDGYDELLQATGKVFSGYLNKVREFQTRQRTLSKGEQPVRAVVTSRFTLIDKAVIPPGSTIIRLLEFDDEQQERWMDKWNIANASYFQQSQTEPFKLPKDHQNIKRLAEQPLLLMMLAIYDAKGNPLSKGAGDLDQSLLYDRLLRRFIERELQKNEESAQSWQEYELDEATDHEMVRLGIAAMGMFNRRTVCIRAKELDDDLKFFGLEESWLEKVGHGYHAATGQVGHQLFPSEKLFGSFFFQKLESVRKTEEAKRDRNVFIRSDDTAYEFLHNTFGEFLTADFMLRKLLEETGKIRDQVNKRSDRNRMFSSSVTAKTNLATFDETWYARLMYAPLFMRPIVLTLLREWSQHCLKKEKRDRQEFLEDFDTILYNHINILLLNNDLPALMTSDQRPFTVLSITGYIAIYTLNLLVLRTLLGDSYTFDETNYTPSEDGTRAWDRLTYLWRSWFSLETLKELAAILQTERDGTKLHLSIKRDPDLRSSTDRLSLVHSVSQTLADNITAGLSGLLLHDAFGERNAEAELDNIAKQLKAEQIEKNLTAYLFTKRFRLLQQQSSIHQEDVLKIIDEASRERSLQSNYEDFASFRTEMLNILHYLIYDIGLNIKIFPIDDFFFFSSLFEELQGLPSVKTTRDTAIESWLHKALKSAKTTRESWPHKDILMEIAHHRLRSGNTNIGTIRAINAYIEITNNIIKQGSWSIPEFLGLEVLDKFLSDNNVPPMRLVAALTRLAREVGDQSTTDFIYQHYLKNMIMPDSPISVELATELVKLARDRGDSHLLDYFVHFLIKKLQGDNEVAVELALEVIKFAREVGDQQALTRFLREYIEDLVSTDRHIPTILTRELLKLAYEINDHQVTVLLLLYIDQLLARNKYVQPELALEIVKLVYQVRHPGHPEGLDKFKSNYLAKMLQAQSLIPVELAVELIKLALQSKEHSPASIKRFYHKNITAERCYLGLLPIDTIVDLRELARMFEDDPLLRKINERLKL